MSGQGQGAMGQTPGSGYGMAAPQYGGMTMSQPSSYSGAGPTTGPMGQPGTTDPSHPYPQPPPIGDPPQQFNGNGGDPMQVRRPWSPFPPTFGPHYPTGPIPTGGGMSPQQVGAPPTLGNPAMGNPPPGVPTGPGTAWDVIQQARTRFPGAYGS